jgi:hypothetical protein
MLQNSQLQATQPSQQHLATILCIQPVLQALNELEYPEKLQKLLLTPNREMGVELVVQMDSGEIEVRYKLCQVTCYAANNMLLQWCWSQGAGGCVL